MAYKDYYKILGIAPSAGEKDIKKAYRKLAAAYHPDKTMGNKEKEERFKEISEAYEVLGNSGKRKQYDALGADWEQFRQSGLPFDEFMEMKKRYGKRPESTYSAGSSGTGYGDASDWSDIFGSFFGGRARNTDSRGFPGADVSGEVSISLREAFTGTERILHVGENKIKLAIRPGAYDGLQLRAKGKGQKGAGRAGDLYVTVRVATDPVFERRGDDLYTQAEVDVFDALLGGALEIQTFSGKVHMKLKEGTQNGKTLRLKGKGMPVYESPDRFGDLFVTLRVRLPERLSEEQKDLLRRLKNSVKEKV